MPEKERAEFPLTCKGKLGAFDVVATTSSVLRDRLPARTRRLDRRNRVGVTEGDADVVETFEQAPARVVVDVDRVDDRVRPFAGLHRAGLEIDRHRGTGVLVEVVPDPL